MFLEGIFNSASNSNRKCCLKGQLVLNLIKHRYSSCNPQVIFSAWMYCQKSQNKNLWSLLSFPIIY